MAESTAPYLIRLKIVPERVPAGAAYPFNVPILREVDLSFSKPVTFFVGENGTGKSTLVEALATAACSPFKSQRRRGVKPRRFAISSKLA